VRLILTVVRLVAQDKCQVSLVLVFCMQAAAVVADISLNLNLRD
jgi:hypothetical protein